MRKTKRTNTTPDTIISLIIVTQNDEEVIEKILPKIDKQLSSLNYNYEIIIVDNGSTDSTVEKVINLNKKLNHNRILSLSRNYNNDTAFTAGLDNCIGDITLLFNLYTDPIEIIPKFIDELSKGNDLVLGKGTLPTVQISPLSKLFIWLVEKLSTQEFKYTQNFLIGLNRKAINAIMRIRRKNRNFSYINSLIGYKRKVIAYTSNNSFESKIPSEGFYKVFFNTVDIIISNSFRPIRTLSFLGLFASASFLLYAMIIAILVLVFELKLAPQGWISLSIVVGSLFFLLFTILTIISEYLIRILNETRNEPFYFIADEIDKSIILPKNTLNIVQK